MAVQPYSDSFEGKLKKEEFLKHIVTNKFRPKAYAYNCKLAYRYPFEKDWLISIPYEKVKLLKKGQYDISIKTKFSDGVMQIPEYIIKGKTDKIILLLADICHPGQADDGIVGISLWIKILQDLEKKNNLNYTYIFFAPTETIGSIAWLWKRKKLLEKIKMGIFLESIGNKRKIKCKLSHKGIHEVDKIAKTIFSKNQIVDFKNGVMNDELVFADPDFNVPIISLQRFPYKEYHTSDDNLSIISETKLSETESYIKKILNMIEANYIPTKIKKGPFYLSKHGLYKEPKFKLDYWKNWSLMNNLNGKMSILEISESLNLDFWETLENIDIYRKLGLIKPIYK